MQPRHQVSRAAIDLIKAFEGYRRAAARLADGGWTIGYGHTLTARQGAEVSEQDAEALLIYDLIAVAHAVNEQTFTPLTQNQFDALCAFAFNIGLAKFRTSSVLRLVNEGQLLQAACGMELWRKADFEGERIVIDALVRRRAAEKTLFLTPAAGWVPAPSPILPPNLDLDLAGSVPQETPAVLTASMEGTEAVAEREPAPFSDGLTATERASAAVSSRLQAIVPDEAEPEAEPEAPAPAKAAWPLASATEQSPLPPPAWPLSFGVSDRTFVLTPPTDQDLEPLTKALDMPGAANQSGVASFKPIGLDVAIARGEAAAHPAAEPTKLRAGAASGAAPAAREAAPARRDLAPGKPTAKPASTDLAPLIGLALLGLALFIGGLLWSGGVREGEGAFNPWIVGTAACLAGVGFVAVAVYFLLLRLDRRTGGEDASGE